MGDDIINNGDEILNSQVIEERGADASAQGRGAVMEADGNEVKAEAPAKEAKTEKPKDIRDAIKKALDDTKPNVGKGEDDGKAKPDADGKQAQPIGKDGKPVAQEQPNGKGLAGKPEKQEEIANGAADEGQRQGEAADANKRQLEGRQFDVPPSRLLPSAREKWANVPTVVKQDFARIMSEHETEVSQLREVSESYAKVAHFDKMAKEGGTTLDQALTKYVNMENMFRQDPAHGFRELMSNLGMQPAQAIGAILRAFNVSPATLAQHISAEPHHYMSRPSMPQQQPQQAPQQRQPDPEVAAIKEQLTAMKVEKIVADVVSPFAAQHPDYFQLEPTIAEIIKSGIIERIHGSNLNEAQKLEVAYRMAGGQPSGGVAQEEAAQPEQPKPRPVDPDGQLSARGAPNGGKSQSPQKKFKSNREALEAAFGSGR